MKAPLLLLLFFLSTVLSASPRLPLDVRIEMDGAREGRITFDSPSLAEGSAPALKEGLLSIVLPASYDSSPTRRYPVVYTFHGYGGEVDELNQAIAPLLEGRRDVPEAILVGVYGGNTFYTDSPRLGQVAKMIVEEVVPLVDSQFRTMATPSRRLLAGFSMGGFAAWSLALAHPEVFSNAWMVCPGAFDSKGVRDVALQWRQGIFSDYVAAFAPERYDSGTRTAKVPRFDGTADDVAYVAQLEKGFGDVAGKLSAFHAKGLALNALRFEYGTQDFFDWITRGTISVATALKKAGLPVVLQDWPTNHEFTDDMIEQGLLPLMVQAFSGS